MLLPSWGSRDPSVSSSSTGQGGPAEWNSPQGLRAGRGYLKETAQVLRHGKAGEDPF